MIIEIIREKLIERICFLMEEVDLEVDSYTQEEIEGLNIEDLFYVIRELKRLNAIKELKPKKKEKMAEVHKSELQICFNIFDI